MNSFCHGKTSQLDTSSVSDKNSISRGTPKKQSTDSNHQHTRRKVEGEGYQRNYNRCGYSYYYETNCRHHLQQQLRFHPHRHHHHHHQYKKQYDGGVAVEDETMTGTDCEDGLMVPNNGNFTCGVVEGKPFRRPTIY